MMHTQIWNQYLPVIKILLKRSATANQTLPLNVSDFERAGLARKAGNKFSIYFSKGRADNAINAGPLAKDFAATMLADPMIKDLFMKADYQIAMSTKYQLSIQCIATATADEAVNEAVATA